jgi:hypothetical protein
MLQDLTNFKQKFQSRKPVSEQMTRSLTKPSESHEFNNKTVAVGKRKHNSVSSYWESFTFCDNSVPHMLPHIYMSSGISIGVPKKRIQ